MALKEDYNYGILTSRLYAHNLQPYKFTGFWYNSMIIKNNYFQTWALERVSPKLKKKTFFSDSMGSF